MRHTAKHQMIRAALDKWPELSCRAIAKLTGTSQVTVGKVRGIIGTPAKRREASGKQARGPRPLTQIYADRLPDGDAFLYRVFDRHHALLFIATSFDFTLRLASVARPPWHRRIDAIRVTHYDSLDDALVAETEAIRREQPRYNSAPRRPEVTPTRPRAAGAVRVAPRPPASTAPPVTTPGRIRRPTGRIPV